MEKWISIVAKEDAVKYGPSHVIDPLFLRGSNIVLHGAGFFMSTKMIAL